MTARFQAEQTALAGLLILHRQPRVDERGSLTRLFDAEDLVELGWQGRIEQLNETVTRCAGTVRGMHFQHPPFAEHKLLTCLSGRIHDIVVDIRRHSPTFLRSVAIELDGDRPTSLLIPPGFAHGFQTLTDNVRLLYAHSQPYRQEAEGGLNPEDPSLNLSWPLAISLLSERDRNHPLIARDFVGLAA